MNKFKAILIDLCEREPDSLDAYITTLKAAIKSLEKEVSEKGDSHDGYFKEREKELAKTKKQLEKAEKKRDSLK